jgi:uncharacterized RDD family membrane protein YckC
MRCPECGYHSFEHMEQCKKCGRDLKEFKAKYGFFGRFLSSGQDKVLEDPPDESIAVEETWEILTDQGPTPSAGSDFEEDEDYRQPEQAFEEPVKESKEEAFEDLPLSIQEEPGFEEEVKDVWENLTTQDPAPSAGSDSEEDEDYRQPEQAFEEPVKESKEEAFEDLPLSIQEEPVIEEEVEEPWGNLTVQEPELSAVLDSEEYADHKQPEQKFEELVKESAEEGFEDLPSSVQEEQAIEDEVDEKPRDLFILSDVQTNQPGETGAEKSIGLSREDEKLTSEPDGGEEISRVDESFPQELSGEAARDFEKEFWPFEDSRKGEQKEPDAAPESPPLFVAEQEKTGVIEDNPPEPDMAPPVAEIADMESQIFPRIGAWLADCSILSLILLAFVMLGKIGLDSQPRQGLFPTQAALLVDLLIPYFFLLFSLCFGYFTVFHFLTGQTPGKMLFNIRVEDENGLPLLFSQAFLRSAGGLLSLLLLGFGYLMIFFNHDGRGWNDRLAGTRVVRVEP